MTATDIRYGRRGGRWASSGAGRLLDDLAQARAQHQEAGTWPHPIDLAGRAHPEAIARTRAHGRTCRGKHPRGEACPAVADPTDVGELWAGRARTAQARQAADVQLDDIDRRALARSPR